MSEGEASGPAEADVSGGQAAEDLASARVGPAPGGQGGYVLDASALLCLMNDEPGAARVAAALSRAVISTGVCCTNG